MCKVLVFPLRMFYDHIGFPIYKKRLAAHIASLCEEGATVLDVGCDIGLTATMIQKNKPSLKITGIDVQTNRPALIERKVYDGKTLPFPDGSFDIVIGVDMLHHNREILPLLAEMKRVARKYVILKEHRSYGFFSKLGISIGDWSANVPYGIKCVYNYPTQQEWQRMFDELGLKLVAMPKVNLGFFLTERYNPIFKLEKQDENSNFHG